MKKIICVFISVLMVVTSTMTMFAETKKDYLAVIGDSIAYGLGIENKDDIYGNIVANERDYIRAKGYDKRVWAHSLVVHNLVNRSL